MGIGPNCNNYDKSTSNVKFLLRLQCERFNGCYGQNSMWSTIGQSLVVRDHSVGKILNKTFVTSFCCLRLVVVYKLVFQYW